MARVKTLFQSKNREVLGLCFLLFALVVSGCEKKEKLQASTFQFSISPPAKAVVKGATQSFSIVSSVGGDTTWTVANSTVGTINTSIGPTVVFSAVDFGDTRISALLNGAMTTAQVTVVSSYAPGVSGTFDVYSDEGLPPPPSLDSDIYVNPSDSSTQYIVEQTGSEWAPEGVAFQRTVIVLSGGARSWGVTLDKGNLNGYRKDLSAYAGKTLKFFIRLHRRLDADAGLIVRVKLESADLGGTGATPPGFVENQVTLDFATHGFNTADTEWQEVHVPLAGFATVDFSNIRVPFGISLINVASSLTFDVDAIRWE